MTDPPRETDGRGDDWTRDKRSEWGAFAGSPGYEERIGEHALAVDRAVVQELLGAEGMRVLDLPCGAGRMSRELAAGHFGATQRLVSADYSPGMLATASRHLANPRVRCDAFGLPFRDASFDRLLMLRLVFHYEDPVPLFREAARVLGAAGELVFDTLNRRSLRRAVEAGLVLRGRRRGRTRLSFLAPESVRAALGEAGFEVAAREARYLLPTRAYRSLPKGVCHALAALENRLPEQIRGLSYWRAVKRS